MTHELEPDDSVRLQLPASSRFIAAARLVAAFLGAEAGLTVDDLDDLRLGVDELLSTLVEGADPTARVELSFGLGSDAVTVAGRVEPATAHVELDELTRRIIAAVTDDYELGPMSFRLTKVSSVRAR